MRSTILRTGLLIAVAGLALAACSGEKKAASALPEQIGTMDREAFTAAVKQVILENPEILPQALENLQRREHQKTFDKLVSFKGDDPVLGPADAPITVVEFFDYNCTYCKHAYPWLLKQVDDKRRDVKVVFKEVAIIANTSEPAARAALAAKPQGKYREMHIALMEAKDLSDATLEKTAKSVGLDIPRWRKDMTAGWVNKHLNDTYRQYDEAQLQGTPGIFINGQFINGFEENMLNKMLDKARAELAEKKG